MARLPKAEPISGVDVVHLGIALLELHEHVMPGEIAGRRVVEALLFELRLARVMLEGGVVDDEGQVGMVQSGLFHVGRIRQVAQRRRLRGVSFVNAEELHAELFDFS